MEIKYDNGYHTPIQESEIGAYDFYSKMYIENGEVMKRQTFLNQKQNKQEFFVGEGETREMLVEQKCSMGMMTAIGERQFVEGFKHERMFYYTAEGDLVGVSNFVFDAEGNCIVTNLREDPESGEPDWEETRKYYYDISIRPDGDLFDCHFQASGKLIPIDIDVEELDLGDHDSIGVINDEEGIQDLIKIFGMTRRLAKFYVSTEIFPWKIMEDTK